MATTPGYVSNAELAARISTLVDRWNTRENQMIALLTNPSGDVIVTDGTGANHTLPSFSQLQADVSALVDELSGAVATTQLAVTEANQHRIAAEDAADAAAIALATLGTAVEDAQTASGSAATSASTADAHRVAAAASALSASNHAANLGDAVADAEASATNAATSYSDANTAKVAAQAARDLANSYANAPQGTQVAPGEYSAKHWAAQAQAAVTGTVVYMGSWDASTGVYPSSPQKGHFYRVSKTGNVGGTWFAAGDQIVHNGSGWDTIDNTDAVTTVAGKSGAVTLVMADITDKGTLATLNAVDWTTHVTGKPSTFTPSAHTHAISEVTGLSTALAGKVDSGGAATFSGVTVTGYVNGSLIHSAGYFNIRPFNGTYDDGSKVEGYYDGNGRVMKMYARQADNAIADFRWEINGRPILTSAGGTVSGAMTFDTNPTLPGVVFKQTLAPSVNDFSNQIQLWAGYGLTITTNRLNIVGAAAATVCTVIGTADVFNVNSTGIHQKHANSGTMTRVPRIFVQAGDPGAAAADGDLWIWG